MRVLTDVGIDGIAQLTNQANRGDVEAQRRLGLLYLTGGDREAGAAVERNPTEAAKWFRMAAEQGDAESQLRLGLAYYHGDGVEQDYVEAAKWLRSPAEDGNAEAQVFLGSVYTLSAASWDRDYGESARWLRLAADQGAPDAQAGLASLYRDGLGVEQDYVQAYMWINLAMRSSATTTEVMERTGTQRGISEKMTPDQIREAVELRLIWEQDHPR